MKLHGLYRLGFHLLYPWRKRIEVCKIETSAGNPRTLNSVAGNLQHFLIILFIQVSSQCLLFLQTHQLLQTHDAIALYKKTANGCIPLEIPHCHKGTVPPATCSFICSVCYNQNILPTDHLDYNIKQNKTVKALWWPE